MGFCICNRTTLLIRSWEAVEQNQPFNVGTEVVVQAASPPDVRTQRWDGAGGLRAATSAEITSYDAAALDGEAQGSADNKIIKAVLIYLVQRLNELRTQPSTTFAALTAQNVKDGVVAIYKTL